MGFVGSLRILVVTFIRGMKRLYLLHLVFHVTIRWAHFSMRVYLSDTGVLVTPVTIQLLMPQHYIP